ncbi:DEAD-box ATP-dependent RNA helicase 28-like [Olea europaea var. sylvestris]|uniref:DEAD-box ATP-dependent RNA helicase 28-like n=1 Tax=Olea europaea var. sylvestris TaxID=158386 RepID=UPI000C1CFC76|nr:DEAD-box ATP-dependent RNA helicase 28-like [Olea europaea var. sylvestris]
MSLSQSYAPKLIYWMGRELYEKVQEAALRSMPDIVVATPGRMIDHLRNSLSVRLDELAVLILDEADQLLELGSSAEIDELVYV